MSWDLIFQYIFFISFISLLEYFLISVSPCFSSLFSSTLSTNLLKYFQPHLDNANILDMYNPSLNLGSESSDYIFHLFLLNLTRHKSWSDALIFRIQVSELRYSRRRNIPTFRKIQTCLDYDRKTCSTRKKEQNGHVMVVRSGNRTEAN